MTKWALKNPRHEKFALLVAEGKTANEAYIAAGFKGDPVGVRGNAGALAMRPEVIERIEEIKEEAAQAAIVTVKRIVVELSRIAFADLSSIMDISDNKITVKDSKHWPKGLWSAVSKVYRSREGEIRVELHSKPAALETLARHLSMFKDQVDLNVQVSLADLVNGSYELERQRQAANQAIDITPNAEQKLIGEAVKAAETYAVEHADSVDEAAKPTDTEDGRAPDPTGGGKKSLAYAEEAERRALKEVERYNKEQSGE